MAVTTLTSATFRSQVLEAEGPVVVDFYADWCGPCTQVSPLVEQMSERWAGRVRFAKIDIDDAQDVAQAYRIMSIPAILLFDGGEPRAWCIGVKPGYLIERDLGLVKRTGHDPDKEARAARKAAKKAEGGSLGRRLFRR